MAVGGIVAGSKLIGVLGEASERYGLESERVLIQQRTAIRKAWSTRARGDWAAEADVEAADYILGQELLNYVPTPAELAATVVNRKPLPLRAAGLIVDRIAVAHPIFRADGSPDASRTARAFAITVVEAALQAALDNPEYTRLLIPHMLIQVGQALGELRDVATDVQSRVGHLQSQQHEVLSQTGIIALELGKLQAQISEFAKQRNIGPEVVVELTRILDERQRLSADSPWALSILAGLVSGFLKQLGDSNLDPILWPPQLREVVARIDLIEDKWVDHSAPVEMATLFQGFFKDLTISDFSAAQVKVDRLVKITKPSYRVGYGKLSIAAENYSKALAAQGMLALALHQFDQALVSFGEAASLEGTSEATRQKIRRHQLSAFNLAISNAKAYKSARRILLSMKDFDVKPTLVSYNMVLSKAKASAERVAILTELTEENLQPDVITYTIAVKAAATYVEAVDAMRQMFSAGVPPDTITYNILIHKLADPIKGLAVAEAMEAAGLQTDVVTYNTIIALAKTYNTCLSVLILMRKKGIFPNIVTYNTLIAKAHMRSTIRKILLTMRRCRIDPDVITFNSLLRFAKSYADCIEILDEMTRRGVRPNELTFCSIVNKASDIHEARHQLRDLTRYRKKNPSESELASVLHKIRTFEGAIAELQSFTRRGYYTGSGLYKAAFSKPITHLSAVELINVYGTLRFRYNDTLEGPLGQYWRAGMLDDALTISLAAPRMLASARLLDEEYEVGVRNLEARIAAGQRPDNLHLAIGKAAFRRCDWARARWHLSAAKTLAFAPKRIAYLEDLLERIPTTTAA